KIRKTTFPKPSNCLFFNPKRQTNVFKA
ncbi:hypothetical protein D046_3088B, partial [Vibrio parahaemolyticus V-223/04]